MQNDPNPQSNEVTKIKMSDYKDNASPSFEYACTKLSHELDILLHVHYASEIDTNIDIESLIEDNLNQISMGEKILDGNSNIDIPNSATYNLTTNRFFQAYTYLKLAIRFHAKGEINTGWSLLARANYFMGFLDGFSSLIGRVNIIKKDLEIAYKRRIGNHKTKSDKLQFLMFKARQLLQENAPSNGYTSIKEAAEKIDRHLSDFVKQNNLDYDPTYLFDLVCKEVSEEEALAYRNPQNRTNPDKPLRSRRTKSPPPLDLKE